LIPETGVNRYVELLCGRETKDCVSVRGKLGGVHNETLNQFALAISTDERQISLPIHADDAP
jgi:hypothetical protein